MFLFNGRYLIMNIKPPFISFEIHGAVQFYFFFFFFFFLSFSLWEEKEVEISENLMIYSFFIQYKRVN
jgi:hypothetical protein